MSDEFNPYSLEDNSLIGLNSMDALHVNRNDDEAEEEEGRGRKKNRGARRSKK